MHAARFREQAALCLRLAKASTSVDMAHKLYELAREYEEAARLAEGRPKRAAAPQPIRPERELVPEGVTP
jgi:hypothetical protein